MGTHPHRLLQLLSASTTCQHCGSHRWHVQTTFTEALWEGYNICTRRILNNDHLTDYCLAVYQQYENSCIRNMTSCRYTVKSVKNISGVSSAFCSCPPYTANTNFPIFCFTCIRLHYEVKSMYLESIEKHFSYQNQANGNFTLNTIPTPLDINFFKAQSLFLKLTPCVPRK